MADNLSEKHDLFEVTPSQLISNCKLQKPQSISIPVCIDNNKNYFTTTIHQLESFLHWHPEVIKITYQYVYGQDFYITKFETK